MYDVREHTLTVEPDQIIFREGDPGDCAYFVESGMVEISIVRDGRSVVITRVGPGDSFGEMAVLDQCPRSATAIAREACRLLAIRRDQLDRRVAESDPVLRVCLSTMVERLRSTTRRIPAADGAAAACNAIRCVPAASDDDRHDAMGALQLEQALHEGIERGQFEPHFQPIVALASGRDAGFEALARWRHPKHGLVRPAAFLPLAEECGMIVALDRQVRRRACEVMARLGDGAFIGVNVSAREFATADFLDALRRTIVETGIDPARVKLELTETCLIGDPAAAAAKLEACRRMGLSVAIDDFGTGYSSLSYLGALPIDAIKIDRSFVKAIEESARHEAIVGAILDLADRIGATVVAEGIETAGQAARLKALGCPFGQGYLFGRPAPEPRSCQAAAAL